MAEESDRQIDDSSAEEVQDEAGPIFPTKSVEPADDGGDDDSDLSDDYDSSDDDHETIPAAADSDTEEDCDPDSDQVLNDNGVPATDGEILERMEHSSHKLEEKKRLLPKIRRYLKCIQDSEGYRCSHFPGYVTGITSVVPRHVVIQWRNRYPEGYNHLHSMACVAIQEYNKKSDSAYKIISVEDATAIWYTDSISYKITFMALSAHKDTVTFQANVINELSPWGLRFVYCGPKLEPSNDKSSSSKEMEEQLYEPIYFLGGLGDEKDRFAPILIMKGFSEDHVLDLIKNDRRCAEKGPAKLYRKVRKYLDSVIDSEGFECTHFPGDIPGLTIVKPRQKILKPECLLVECYTHIYLMAIIAIESYSKDAKAKFQARCQLERVNSYKNTYYITFTALDEEWEVHRFQAVVQDNVPSMYLLMCRMV